MLTPGFSIHQDDEFITIIIHARFAKVAETEIFIQEEEFKFYSKPYFLRLNLPGKLVEDGRESAKFDVETGQFTVRIPKHSPGEQFHGLDMITKLLAPKGTTNAKAPLIEVLNSEEATTAEADKNASEEEEDFDWQIEQLPCSVSENQTALSDSYKYGFANLRSGVFLRLQDELHGVIDVADPDKVSPPERTKERLQKEEEKFDAEYYMADFAEDHTIQEILMYEPSWVHEYRRLKKGENPDKIVILSEEDIQRMKELPNKEYILDNDQQAGVLLSLVDIIFAYAYDQRTTEGEGNVESAWTIRKLCATLSWLESFTSLKTVVHSCIRRAVSYPLYRHWKLTKKVLRDTTMIFSLGRRRLLKCLLEIHSCLNQSDPYYILNDLYITDYCIWIQGVSEKRLSSLMRCLSKIKVEKEELSYELVELERAVELAQEEEKQQNELSEGVANICLQNSTVETQDTRKTCEKMGDNMSTVAGEDSMCEKLAALLIGESSAANTLECNTPCVRSREDIDTEVGGVRHKDQEEISQCDNFQNGTGSKTTRTAKSDVDTCTDQTLSDGISEEVSDSEDTTSEETDSDSSCDETSSSSDADESCITPPGGGDDNLSVKEKGKTLISVIESSESEQI